MSDQIRLKNKINVKAYFFDLPITNFIDNRTYPSPPDLANPATLLGEADSS